MTDAKIDDYTGQVYNPEDTTTYTIEVKTRRPFRSPEGKDIERTERLFFEVTHDSFMQTIAKMFEGKKVLSRWEHWDNPSEEVLAKYPKARGKWVKNNK